MKNYRIIQFAGAVLMASALFVSSASAAAPVQINVVSGETFDAAVAEGSYAATQDSALVLPDGRRVMLSAGSSVSISLVDGVYTFAVESGSVSLINPGASAGYGTPVNIVAAGTTIVSEGSDVAVGINPDGSATVAKINGSGNLTVGGTVVTSNIKGGIIFQGGNFVPNKNAANRFLASLPSAIFRNNLQITNDNEVNASES